MATPLTPSRYSSAQNVSMADSLPSIDFGFDDLRERMNAFTAKFDDFIARGRKRVWDERNAFAMRAAEMQESRRNKRQAMADIEQKSILHAHTVAKEEQEARELADAITSLKQEKDQREQRRQELQNEMLEVQAQIKQRKAVQLAEQQALTAQAENDVPELQAWEELLGLRIIGAETGTEKLRFIFKDLDNRSPDRQAWFDMDFAQRSPTIQETRPKLAKDDLARLEESLHETRDVGALLKSMRGLFISASKGS